MLVQEEIKKVEKVNIFRNPFRLKYLLHNPITFFTEKLNLYNGFFELTGMRTTTFLTNRPEIARHVLQKNHKNYGKTRIVREFLKPRVGNGLLTSDGDFWLRHRRAIQPGFHRKRLEAISGIMLEEIEGFMEKYMDPLAESGEVFDMSKEMTRLAFLIVSKSLFAGDLDEKDLTKIDATISNTQQFLIYQIRMPYMIPFLKLRGDYKKMDRLKEESDNLILETIHKRMQTNETKDDLLDMLIETRYADSGKSMSIEQIKDEAVIMYVAGHETSAIALTWMWYLLASHPEIEEKVLAHLDEVLGEKKPAFADLRNSDYTLQVIEETMRLYPPAWITDREALEDDMIDGYQVKKGQDVTVLIHAIHHSPEYWDEPEAFRPERFSAENKKKQEPYTYLPFGGGPRQCIGNNFALMEMQFVLMEMLRRYTFEVVPGQDIDIKPMITLRPKNGIKMRIKRR